MIIPRIYTGAVATVRYTSICNVKCISSILSQDSTDLISLSAGIQSSSCNLCFFSQWFDVLCRFAGASQNYADINIPKVMWLFLILKLVQIFRIRRLDILCWCNYINYSSDRKSSPKKHKIQDLFARLVVLLHNPLAREQLVTHILAVSLLYHCLISNTIVYYCRMVI